MLILYKFKISAAQWLMVTTDSPVYNVPYIFNRWQLWTCAGKSALTLCHWSLTVVRWAEGGLTFFCQNNLGPPKSRCIIDGSICLSYTMAADGLQMLFFYLSVITVFVIFGTGCSHFFLKCVLFLTTEHVPTVLLSTYAQKTRWVDLCMSLLHNIDLFWDGFWDLCFYLSSLHGV